MSNLFYTYQGGNTLIQPACKYYIGLSREEIWSKLEYVRGNESVDVYRYVHSSWGPLLILDGIDDFCISIETREQNFSCDLEPKPIGKCPKCGTDVYSVEGFCGGCEPWKR